MKKLLYSLLLLGSIMVGCRKGQNAEEIAPAPQVTLASFRGNVLGQELIIKEDPNDPFSYDSPVSARLLVGQTEPDYINHQVYIRSKGVGSIFLDVPSMPFRGYSFAMIQELFVSGPKQFNLVLPQEDRNGGMNTARYREGFDFTFVRADWGNVGISTIGDQTGSTLEVLSSREIAPPANSGVLRALEVSFRMNAKLYADSDQVYGEVKNAELTLKFYYFGQPKFK